MLPIPKFRGLKRCFMVEGILNGDKVYLTVFPGSKRWMTNAHEATKNGGYWAMRESASEALKTAKEIYGEIDTVENPHVINATNLELPDELLEKR